VCFFVQLSRLGLDGPQGELLLLVQVFRKASREVAVPFIPQSIRPKLDEHKWCVGTQAFAVSFWEVPSSSILRVWCGVVWCHPGWWTSLPWGFATWHRTTSCPSTCRLWSLMSGNGATQTARGPHKPRKRHLGPIQTLSSTFASPFASRKTPCTFFSVRVPQARRLTRHVFSSFAPSLNMRVRDTRLGGFTKPTIGTCAIPLSKKIPWSADYEVNGHRRLHVDDPFAEQVRRSVCPNLLAPAVCRSLTAVVNMVTSQSSSRAET